MKLRIKHVVMCIVATAALASVAWAGDVWKDKKPADWSAKEMEKFLTRSPWARTVQPAMNPPSTDQGPRGTGQGGWGGPGGGGGAGGWGGGGAGGWGGGGVMPIMTFQVRWVSAPIMREALKVAESEPLNAAIAKYAPDYYIVSVTMQIKGGSGGGGQWGAPGSGQQGTAGSNGQSPSKEQQEEAHKRFEVMLVQGATLRFGGQAVHPVKAEMTPCKAGMATLYLFPRTLKLEEAAKEYVFELAQGTIVTRASFTLKGFEEAPEKGL